MPNLSFTISPSSIPSVIPNDEKNSFKNNK